MGLRGKIFTATIVTLGLLSIVAVYYLQREPHYKGPSLSQCVTICRSSEISQAEREEAAATVRQIGTNDLHFLVRRATEPSPKEKFQAFIGKLRIPLPNFVRQWANTP